MVQGQYFDARSARGAPAELRAVAGRWQLSCEGAQQLLDPHDVTVTDRIGSIPRRVRLPDGSEFETRDNDGVDALLHEIRGRSGGFVHTLERRWPVAVVSLLVVAVVSVVLVRTGLPMLAEWGADRVPPRADRAIGTQVLQVLDRAMLKPTGLHPRQRARLLQVFDEMTADIDDGHDYRLEFRRSAIGANALALPSGIVILTDDMVRLAQDEDELKAVMAHEIGHVRGRHSLRMLLQNAGVSALMLVLVGDVGTISAVVTSAAPVLLQARYSRDIEREADAFARDWLLQRGIDPAHFDHIMCRLSESMGGREMPAFVSSHPPTDERARCGPA